jgi:hypothetical protein
MTKTIMGDRPGAKEGRVDLQALRDAELLRGHADRLSLPLNSIGDLWALAVHLAREVERLQPAKQKRLAKSVRGRKPDKRGGVGGLVLLAELRALMSSGRYETEAAALREMRALKYRDVLFATLKRRVAAAKLVR